MSSFMKSANVQSRFQLLLGPCSSSNGNHVLSVHFCDILCSKLSLHPYVCHLRGCPVSCAGWQVFLWALPFSPVILSHYSGIPQCTVPWASDSFLSVKEHQAVLILSNRQHSQLVYIVRMSWRCKKPVRTHYICHWQKQIVDPIVDFVYLN